MTTRITLPKNLDLTSSIHFTNQLFSIEKDEYYIFDFRQVSHVEPFGLLIVSDSIDRFRIEHASALFTAEHFEHLTYAGHMGFFKAFGLQFGKMPGEASGSSSYLPITIVSSDTIRRLAANKYKEIGDVVDEHAARLASMLLQERGGVLFDTVQFCLREVSRNIVEHSESDRFSYCAQYWNKNKTVQIAIVDRGIGLSASLRQNQKLPISSDKDAVQLALMPGVSRVGILPQSKADHDPWANSGFGLYMTSRICREGGRFTALSGTAAIELSRELKTVHIGKYAGTALALEINMEAAQGLSERLATFRDEGIKAARTYFHSEQLTASTASTMLSRNFN